MLYYPYYEPPSNWLRSFLLFFDTVRTIVPSDAKYVPSPEISSILDIYPTALNQIAPSNVDTEINETNRQILRNAFQLIAEKNHSSTKTVKLLFDPHGDIRIEGHTFLHESKISLNVRDLLLEYNLINNGISDVVREISNIENYFVVNEEASNLIISCISDKLALRYGLPAVTDIELDFAVNSVNSIYQTRNAMLEAKSYLAQAIIGLQVPQNISILTPKQYSDIREAYCEIREPFQKLITQMCAMHNLSFISDAQILEEKTKSLAIEVNEKVERIRNSRLGQRIHSWAPIFVGGLINILGKVLFTDNQSIQMATPCVSTLIQVIQEITKKPIFEDDRVYHLIGNLNKRLIGDVSQNLIIKTNSIPKYNPYIW